MIKARKRAKIKKNDQYSIAGRGAGAGACCPSPDSRQD
jgi:hypothetical protein